MRRRGKAVNQVWHNYKINYHNNNNDKHNKTNNNITNNNNYNKDLNSNDNNLDNNNKINNIRTSKQWKINIIWFNPSINKNVATKIGTCFLNVIEKHFS